MGPKERQKKVEGERQTEKPSEPDKKRIAVLPFANISPDPADEYFSDGMTEEMISTLAKVRGLEVISRTSVMQYKNKPRSVVDIGRELNVGTLLEGSVRKAGNKVRITVQLIEAGSDRHLWVENFDRNLDDIFAIQSDIAGNISQALRVKLVSAESAKRLTENIEAYTLYLKGRSLWNKRDREGVLGSLKLFQEAIRIDPDYARAYAGLADAYHVAAHYDFMDGADGLTKSKEAATKALELDDTLAEAYVSLGAGLFHDMKYEEALRKYRKAIEVNPSYATAHQWYSECLREVGRMKEAMEEIERARELDPLSSAVTLSAGIMYHQTGRVDEAIAVCDKVIENEPTFAYSYWNRALCFMYKGMKERAYADFEASHKLRRDEDEHKVNLAFLYGWFGEREKALPMIEELIPKAGKSSVREQGIANCYAALGDREEFFRWIDKAISAKRITVADLRSSPVYVKVREDSRFPEIFKKLGLPY